MPIVPGLLSPYEAVRGFVYLPRLISKIRLHAAGQLHPDFVNNLGKAFDDRCCQYLGVGYDDLRVWVLQHPQATAEEVLACAHDTSPDAYAKVVDRLLASPAYGERWARHWMDLMRYAESRGHESDYAIANAWQYRDYLVRAFNEDVPYDRFLQEHLAGDLLSPPRLRPGTEHNESVLGTGWAFLGEEVHSPVDIRQDECDRIDNKIDVFTKSFLGLTVAFPRVSDDRR